jgi:hypothetical protein
MLANIKKILIAIIIFPLAAAIAGAQGGSNYSMFGIGDIFHSIGASYNSLGGTSAAFPSEKSINTRNPALWSKVTTTRLQTGYIFNQHLVQEGPNELWQNNGQVNKILGIFSIDTSLGISLSFGIHPYSSVNYLVMTPISETVEGLTVNGRTIYQGGGGLSLAYFGGAVEVMDGFSAGAAIFATFGRIDRMTLTEFYKSSLYDQVFDYELDKRDYFSGYGWRAGVYYETPFGLAAGAFFENHPGVSAERDEIHYSSLQRDTTFGSEIDLVIPDYYGFGVSYSTGKFILGADISFQDFSAFDYGPGSDTKFTGSTMLSAGVHRIGSRSSNARFLDRIGYKFGAGYNNLYYQLAGNHISEYFASFGAEIPLGSDSYIDAAISLGSRGTNDSDLILEYFGRFSVDISIGDTWFQPYRRY